MSGSPRAILLATDLSARCDRALDRAVLLAREWKARLVAVTVVDPAAAFVARELVAAPAWPQRIDPVDAARRRLQADIDADDVDLVVRVEDGHPGEILLRAAREFDCGLVVTGIARNETLGRRMLGSTVDWLVRHAAPPVLVVRNRARGPYADLLAASDLSLSARDALALGTRLFPGGRLTVLNAVEVPMLGLRQDAEAAVERARSEALLAARAELEAARVPAAQRAAARLVAEPGDPARLLQAYVRDHGSDLVLLATHGRGALFDLVIGSTARRILDAVETDVLVVRDPRAQPAIAG